LALIANTARVVMSMALGSESLRLPQFPVRNKPVLNLLELPAVFLSWSGTPPLVAALAAQASAVALWKGYPLAAAMFLGASAAALTAFAIATGAYEPRPDQDPPRTLWSLLASLLLAATFSTAGLQLSLNLQPNDGGWMSGTRHAIGRLFHGAPAVETKPADQPEPEVTPVYIPAAPAGRSLSDGEYSGLVLREKDKPQTVKMMSLPLRSGLFRLTRPSNVIPFTGVYWLFRPPARQPPLSATIRNGSPIDSRFMTTDGAPIELEAHQRLNPPVDVASCRRIQVTVRDSERGPVPLYAHMKLYNRSDGQVQDLGLTDASIGASHRSVIEFALPASPFLRRFNEIEVAFYLAFFNNSRSARVQVESFTLLSY
jgi:hypothetical protein